MEWKLRELIGKFNFNQFELVFFVASLKKTIFETHNSSKVLNNESEELQLDMLAYAVKRMLNYNDSCLENYIAHIGKSVFMPQFNTFIKKQGDFGFLSLNFRDINSIFSFEYSRNQNLLQDLAPHSQWTSNMLGLDSTIYAKTSIPSSANNNLIEENPFLLSKSKEELKFSSSVFRPIELDTKDSKMSNSSLFKLKPADTNYLLRNNSNFSNDK